MVIEAEVYITPLIIHHRVIIPQVGMPLLILQTQITIWVKVYIRTGLHRGIINMKKLLLPLLIITLLCLSLPLNDVKARQGCCSHHGGVCGCGCCDGTSLSATCAPYYPQCNSKPVQTYVPPVTQPNYNNNVQESKPLTGSVLGTQTANESSDSSFNWWWVIGIGFVGFIIYKIIKRKK